jgi:hypothetical protein
MQAMIWLCNWRMSVLLSGSNAAEQLLAQGHAI